MAADTLSDLAKQNFINLTTFRKDGTGVLTTVWFAEDQGKLYVLTPENSGKIKRLRRNQQVVVAPSTFNSKPRGPERTAQARLLSGAEASRAEALIAKKYGWQLRLINWISQFRPTADDAFIEIRLV